jgi:hypothetical protein
VLPLFFNFRIDLVYKIEDLVFRFIDFRSIVTFTLNQVHHIIPTAAYLRVVIIGIGNGVQDIPVLITKFMVAGDFLSAHNAFRHFYPPF